LNSFERVSAALSLTQPDRVPILTYLNGDSPNISPRLKQFVLDNSDVFCTRGLYTGFACTGTDADTSEVPLDYGWARVTHTIGGESFDEVIKQSPEGLYVGYKKHIFGDPCDLQRLLELPFAPAAGNHQLDAWIAEANFAARKYYAEGAFTRIVLMDPLGVVAGNASPEDMSIWTLEQRPLLRKCMDRILEQHLEYLAYALERIDAPVIYNIAGAEYALPPLMSPADFDEFVLAYDFPIIDLVHSFGKLIFYHSHGKVRSFLPQFIEMGADGIHPLEPVGPTGDCDLAEVKAAFGKDICLIGNIQYDDFARLSGEALRDRVREVVLAGKPGGGFILCPSCTPFHNPMPTEIEDNIIRFIEAGLESGRY
jgi:hypothetical protein